MLERNTNDELDADIHAMLYLAKGGYNKAVKIIKEHSIERHGHQI